MAGLRLIANFLEWRPEGAHERCRGSAGGRVTVERLTQYSGTDLDDLCEATESAILEGGGFGWLKVPPRQVLENYWKGVLLVPERQPRRRPARRRHRRLGAARRGRRATTRRRPSPAPSPALLSRPGRAAAASATRIVQRDRGAGARARPGRAEPRSARHASAPRSGSTKASAIAAGARTRATPRSRAASCRPLLLQAPRRAGQRSPAELGRDPVPRHRPEGRRLRPSRARRDGERDRVQRRSGGAGARFAAAGFRVAACRRSRRRLRREVGQWRRGAGDPRARSICSIQLGGGIRDRAAIDYWLGLGIDRVVLGTAALRDPELVRRAAADHPGRIVVGIDARDGRVAVEGWAETSDDRRRRSGAALRRCRGRGDRLHRHRPRRRADRRRCGGDRRICARRPGCRSSPRAASPRSPTSRR